MPSAAYREYLTAPEGLLDEILEARAFTSAVQALKQAEAMGSEAVDRLVQDSELAALAQDIEFAEQRRKLGERLRGAE